jgi:hypothetical protein
MTEMQSREVAVEAGRHGLIASVAYALWEERKRRNAPDDPEADWRNAQELVEDLEEHQPLAGN